MEVQATVVEIGLTIAGEIASFGEEERAKAEITVVRQLVNIQSGYPAFYKFANTEKSVVVQSPCDGLAKAIQQYRLTHGKEANEARVDVVSLEDKPSVPQKPSANRETGVMSATAGGISTNLICSKCGGESWLRIDGCNVCQSCGYSKCG